MTEQNPSLRSIILLGSSRSQGNTHRLASAIAPQLAAEVVDLNDYTIAAYDYQYQNQHDDFLPLIRHALSYDRLILSSPM
ncbi:MAG: NAD(P)H-dependent oxidoreductase [Burkholderiales bacterium]|nr:NAD(P)H-dependent oxidoreductase [Burkholderiales bacterium]